MAMENEVVTTKIHVTSRASVKVRDSFFTVEYGEEREIRNPSADLIARKKAVEDARAELWDLCNSEVDKQVIDILK